MEINVVTPTVTNNNTDYHDLYLKNKSLDLHLDLPIIIILTLLTAGHSWYHDFPSYVSVPKNRYNASTISWYL